MNAAITAGAQVSITARMNPAIKRAIATIGEDDWETIEYTDAIFDEQTRQWISNAEVAEVPFTAFTSRTKTEQVVGRLVVRRIPELNKKNLEHPTLFDIHRFHTFFTTSTLDTITADKTHRGHAPRRRPLTYCGRTACRHPLASSSSGRWRSTLRRR